MLQQPIYNIYGLPKTCCEHGRPTGNLLPSHFPALTAPMQRPLVVLARLVRFHHQFLSPPRGQRASSEPRLLPRTGGRELPLVPPSVGGISPISNPPRYLTSFPFGHQLASVSAEQGDTRHQIPSACHGGTTGCHWEPSCVFSTAYAGTFLFTMKAERREEN